ncbi:hypothetical protein NPIL_46141 [Nephila pilipes]|uniref:Uncharacterized protein n=1 Tax=Nephila pilipes TaxID=299642 RepID=A0A8X6Q5H0_NEPPI|nr:hypothetical protein NPIL_46141 [Nephila pilipes]
MDLAFGSQHRSCESMSQYLVHVGRKALKKKGPKRVISYPVSYLALHVQQKIREFAIIELPSGNEVTEALFLLLSIQYAEPGTERSAWLFCQRIQNDTPTITNSLGCKAETMW